MRIVEDNLENIDFDDLYNDIVVNEEVVIVKNLFDKEILQYIPSHVFSFFSSMPQAGEINYQDPDSFSKVNFWKFERGVSANQKSLHSFKSYFINNFADIPREISEPLEMVCERLYSIYKNLINKTSVTATEFDGGKIKHRPQLLQYHRGGGFFSAHIHPFEPMKVGVVLSLSTKGIDYEIGGGGFEVSSGEIVDTSNLHELGDVCLFKYSLKHWVLPTDPDLPLMNDSSGRWSLVVPIY